MKVKHITTLFNLVYSTHADNTREGFRQYSILGERGLIKFTGQIHAIYPAVAKTQKCLACVDAIHGINTGKFRIRQSACLSVTEMDGCMDRRRDGRMDGWDREIWTDG